MSVPSYAFGQSCGPGAAGNGVDALGEESVHAAQNTVLFVDHSWAPQDERRGNRRKARVASKADDDRRAIQQHPPKRHERATQKFERHQCFGQQPALRECADDSVLIATECGKPPV